MRDNPITRWLEGQQVSVDYHWEALAGGDINHTGRLDCALGEFCVKTNPQAPADFFTAEAHGLEALRAANPLPVPRVIHVDTGLLVLEYLPPAPRSTDYWETLGQGLAELHRQQAAQFGLSRDNYCGLTPQPNRQTDNGYDFFAEQRLLYLAERAARQGLLSSSEVSQIDSLAQRLPELVPPEPAALLHGDLWGGNIHTGPKGQPVLIDPAVYYGWREIDLAMTQLFGGFAEGFYRAYQASYPLQPGWRERIPLYNLYPLLNHLNLFGGGYHSQVMASVRAFQ